MSRLPKPPFEFHVPIALAYIDSIKNRFPLARKDIHDAIKYIINILKNLESQNTEYRAENKSALKILETHPHAATVDINFLPEIIDFFDRKPIIFAKNNKAIIVFSEKSDAIICKLKKKKKMS